MLALLPLVLGRHAVVDDRPLQAGEALADPDWQDALAAERAGLWRARPKAVTQW